MKLLMVTLLVMASLAAGNELSSGELTIGERLPDVKAEYLTGRKAHLPQDASGRVALLLFGFSYDSRFAVEAWTKRFRADFDKTPGVTFYEIPMIGGLARMGKWFIDSGMRRGTPKTDRENVITVYGDTDAWKQRLGVTKQDWAYLVLVDQKGNVLWTHAGLFEEAPYRDLSLQVRKIRAGQ